METHWVGLLIGYLTSWKGKNMPNWAHKAAVLTDQGADRRLNPFLGTHKDQGASNITFKNNIIKQFWKPKLSLSIQDRKYLPGIGV